MLKGEMVFLQSPHNVFVLNGCLEGPIQNLVNWNNWNKHSHDLKEKTMNMECEKQRQQPNKWQQKKEKLSNLLLFS